MRNIWKTIRFIPEYRSRIAGIFAVGAVLGLIGTAVPYLFKHVVDVVASLVAGRITQDAAARSVLWLVVGFVVLRLALVLFGALQDKQSDDLWLDTVSTFRQRVFDNMTRLSIDYFEKTRAGEIVDRFSTITQITLWLFSMTEGVLASAIQLLFILAALLWKAPLAGLAMSGVVFANIAVSRRTMMRTGPYRRGWQRLAGRMTGLLAEMVANISTVRSFGGESAVKQRYDDTQAEWRVTRGTLHRMEWRANLVLSLINAGGVCIVVTVVAGGGLRGGLTPGDMLFVLTLTNILFTTVAPIARQFNQAGDVESSAERLVELLDVEQQIEDAPGAIELSRIDEILFDDVGFTYPGTERPALKHISFRLPAGRSLALVGRSGSGKSTIIKLLTRFYDPGEGRILINGRDIRDYRQQSLRRQFGVVLQDVALFNDSIAENIAFASPGATPEQISAAAEVAQAARFIERMPLGYDTIVGERGVRLSGGEKQRLAIARAVLRDPELIILDEATSALDSEAEAMVQAALDGLLAGRTSIAIAHRLSTIRRANHILVLQDGRVVAQGVHDSLVDDPNGYYTRAVTLQAGGDAHVSSGRKLSYAIPE